MRTLLLLAVLSLSQWAEAQALDTPALDEIFAGSAVLSGYASGVALEWTTLDERDVDYFTVLRQQDATQVVVATFEPRGQKDSTTRYRYIDQSEFTHDLAFVLRVAFIDGTFAETAALEAQTAHSRRTRILSALDEQSLASLRISLDSEAAQLVDVEVRSLKGELYDSYQRSLHAGVNSLEVDYGSWPAGYYTVEVTDATEHLTWLVKVDPDVPLATTRRIPARS